MMMTVMVKDKLILVIMLHLKMSCGDIRDESYLFVQVFVVVQ